MEYPKCIGCGFCCLQAKCTVAVRLYPAASVCPELIWSDKDNRHNCGLMQLPGPVGIAYREELHAGAGCCSNLNTWRKDVRDRTAKTTEPLTLDPTFQLFLNVLGKQWIGGDMLALTMLGFIGALVDRGLESSKATDIGNLALAYIENNRTTSMKNFMG